MWVYTQKIQETLINTNTIDDIIKVAGCKVNIYSVICLFILKYIFIYLAVPGLICSMQDLYLWHANSLVAPCDLLAVACGIYFPNQGLNLGPIHWELKVLSTGLPEVLQHLFFMKIFKQTRNRRKCLQFNKEHL